MKNILVKIICLVLLNYAAIAQSKEEAKYKNRAAEVRTEISNNAGKAFTVITVPTKYKDESAVIIAKYYEVSGVEKNKLHTTFHERIFINDKSALEEFSTLNYKKALDRSSKKVFSKIRKTATTFIGIKIFKPDGKAIDVDVEKEEVLIQKNTNDLEGKIAIPDLQTGDILDYYVRIEELNEEKNKNIEPDYIFPVGEYNTLYLKIKYTLNNNMGVDILSLNTAKEFTKSTDNENNIVLELEEKELPKNKTSYWISREREQPCYLVKYGKPGNGIIADKAEVKQGVFLDYYKNELIKTFNSYDKNPHACQVAMDVLKKYFGGKKKFQQEPVDNVVEYLYNFFRWKEFGVFGYKLDETFWIYDDRIKVDFTNKRNYRSMDNLEVAYQVSRVLDECNIDHEILVTRSRLSGWLKDVFSGEDFNALIHLKSQGKYQWLSFNDYFQGPGQLAADYQGENAFVLQRTGKPKYEFKDTLVKLPVMISDSNMQKQRLKITFTKENLQLVNIDRTVTETGAMKQNDQKKLITADNVEYWLLKNVNTKYLGARYFLIASTNTKFVKELMYLQNEAVDKLKGDFEKDVKEQYGQAAKEFFGYQILNMGLSAQGPGFEYTDSFTMENLVKKAGNNLVFDIGKMIGVYKKPGTEERIRVSDVYMPCARSFTYSFDITVPDGFKVKGMEALNTKEENDIASFITSGKENGNMVNINVALTYKNNFEPAANWPKLLAVMDAAAGFTQVKLLLEKKQ